MSVRPRLSVCQLSLPDTTFEQDLDLIKASGATGVAIAELKLRDGEEAAQIAALKESGLTATICIPNNTRSEEHTSELQSLMRISYAVFCLKKKKTTSNTHDTQEIHITK